MPWLAALGGSGGAAAGAGAGAGAGAAGAGAAGAGAGAGAAGAAGAGLSPALAAAPDYAASLGSGLGYSATGPLLGGGPTMAAGAPAAAGGFGSNIMDFLGQHFGGGTSINNFARGVMQGYGNLPVGTQGFGMNATTFGQGLGSLLNRPSGGPPAQAPPTYDPRQRFQMILQQLAQQRQKMTPYSAGGGGMF